MLAQVRVGQRANLPEDIRLTFTLPSALMRRITACRACCRASQITICRTRVANSVRIRMIFPSRRVRPGCCLLAGSLARSPGWIAVLRSSSELRFCFAPIEDDLPPFGSIRVRHHRFSVGQTGVDLGVSKGLAFAVEPLTLPRGR